MPVPVPVHGRYPVHRVVKPQGDIRGAFPSVAPDPVCDNTLKYVIQSTCQPSTLQAGFVSLPNTQETLSNWLETKLFSCGSGVQFSSRPRVAPESSDFQHGLAAADDAAISKQVHAEACRSPVRRSDSHSMTMGLQHFSDQLGSSDSTWTSYETDSATCAAGFISKADMWNFDRGNSSHMYYSKDAFPIMGSNQQPGYDIAEQLCDGLLQPAATPFADFVDRIVGTEATRASDHYALDTPESHPPVDTPCRHQQPASSEPLSNPTYIRAYRAMAEPLSEWMADYVWKICTTGIGLPPRFVGVGTSRYYMEKPSSALGKSIHTVLCSTLLQPSAIVLALWYITRLPVFFDGQIAGVDLTPSEIEFRKELYGEGQFYSSGERSQPESRAPFRIALLGCMLANKWLDDHTFSNKTWQSISDVSIQSINRLELSALAVLGHDLSIAPKAWEFWLSHLHQYQSTVCSYPAPICRPSGSESHAIVRKMVMDLAHLHNRSGANFSSSIITAQPVFSPLLLCDAETKVEPRETGTFDPFEIDLDEDGPLREEYIPKRRSSASKTDAHKRVASVEAKDMMQISPPLPPPSEWSPNADPPLQRDARRRGSYLTVTAPGPGNASHGRSFSAYSQASAWDVQGGFKISGLPSLSHQADSRNVRPVHGFQSMAFGFPISTTCLPISHARTTLSSAAPSAQSTTHVRSYSQSHASGNDIFNHPPAPCPQYMGHFSAFSHGQGDPCHFRPLWLKT